MSDQYPTIREVLDGDAPFPSNAAHNEEGMYVMPDKDQPTVVDDDMVQSDSGLWLPKPTHKAVTCIYFDSGLMLQVTESQDIVRELIKTCLTDARDAQFTGPEYNDPVIVRSFALMQIMALTTAYIDLSVIELNEKQKEHNMKMAELAMTQQRAAMLMRQGRNNNRRR